jgi:hypothetical protein
MSSRIPITPISEGMKDGGGHLVYYVSVLKCLLHQGRDLCILFIKKLVKKELIP